MLKLDGTNLVVGLGKSGLSMLRVLVWLGAKTIVVDSRTQPPELDSMRSAFPEIPCYLGNFDPAVFLEVNRIFISPGVSKSEKVIIDANNRGLPIWSDIELLSLLTKVPVIAITGSNGKSTVTTLLGKMAELSGYSVAVGGNLGIPALDLWFIKELGHSVQKLDLYVLELSSFQLESTYNLNAQVAVVLNISPDHMDRYPTMNNYIMTKSRIFHGSGVMVINADDNNVVSMIKPDRETLFFTIKRSEELRTKSNCFCLLSESGKIWLAHGMRPLIATTEMHIYGYHNYANALAALAMGHAIGFKKTAMLEAIRTFRGLAHRMELIAVHNGIYWFNDSKGTNVGATIAAISSIPEKVILIAGGDGKGQDFLPLKAAIHNKVRCVILIGRDAKKIAKVISNDQSVGIMFASNMEEAVIIAAKISKPSDSVLLSPACASLDMFKSYEERGILFTQAVRRLVAKC